MKVINIYRIHSVYPYKKSFEKFLLRYALNDTKEIVARFHSMSLFSCECGFKK